MVQFMFCLVAAAGGLGFLGAALIIGPAQYQRGRDHQRREHEMAEYERSLAGYRVLEP